MFRRLVLFAIVAGWLSLAGQGQTSAPPALVEGSVVNKLTGAPVKHAHVIYIKASDGNGKEISPINTDTDPGGHFSISLAPGVYRMWAERQGFSRHVYGALTPEGSGVPLVVTAGQQIRDLTFRIVPLGVISGRVLDDDGEPVQSAGIQVLRFSYATGKRQLLAVAGASSDDRGEYRVFGLPAGRYYLLATLPGNPMSRPIESSALIPEALAPFAPMYYPGVTELDSASQLTLPQGAELNDIDFHLQRVRAVTLRGRLFSPIEDFSRGQLQVVLAHNDDNGASYIDRAVAAVDRSSGKFELRGVGPGLYWLVASQLNAGRALGGRTPVEVAPPNSQENLAISLRQSFDIGGTIEIEGKTPMGLGNAVARLSPAEGLALGTQPMSRIGADGSLRFTGVTPGLWDLTLDPLPQGMWIKSATFGEYDVSSGEIIVTANGRGPLHITLTTSGAQISGTVGQDNHPRAATVVLAPDSDELRRSPRLYRVTSAQDQGAFSFAGVPPGSYKLFAFEEIEPNAWLDPGFLKPVEALGEAITVSAGEKIVRQLTPVPPDALLPQR